METLVLTGLALQRGCVVGVTSSGEIRVADALGNPVYVCAFLRTSAAPPPPMQPNDEVVFAADPGTTRGYVFGKVEAYQEMPKAKEGPPDALRFTAQERIELRCGDGSLILRADGKVIVKGNEVVSCARGVNKVKGAAVRIN